MFTELLITMFLISAATCSIVAFVFRNSVRTLLNKLFPVDLAASFRKYLLFAIYVIGIGGGVRLYDLQRYIDSPESSGIERAAPPPGVNGEMRVAPVVLDSDRWTLEIVRSVIETMQSVAVLLFLFFLTMLIVHLVVRNRPNPPTS